MSWAFLLLALAVFVGAAIQGAIGFGFALVAAPVMALLHPGSVPVAVICIALPMAVVMAVREGRHIDLHGFVWIVGGRVLGTVVGLWVLVTLPAHDLEATIGGLILVAVLLSVAGLDVRPTPASTFGAGIVSGVMGTTAAIGGPALAVVYQRRPGAELRSTLAISFVVGLVLSFSALLLAGEVRGRNVLLGIELLPALALGLLTSPAVSRRIGAERLRPAVLTFAGAAGAFICIRALLRG
ncbi:MAG TPA: sulfite exporter TauE/SafE family protein [Actinomycetota bacterium]|nr:sulfite exporter TauE/SafE family protein [Actinomycetota bacterium]